jgi:hypothetical protein
MRLCVTTSMLRIEYRAHQDQRAQILGVRAQERVKLLLSILQSPLLKGCSGRVPVGLSTGRLSWQ